MRQALSISELAKSADVTSKTLRYWERLGLLPKARTHTGYRVFDSQAAQHINFIQKAKTVGLTLKEVKWLMELSRKGKNPSPQVVKRVDEKAVSSWVTLLEVNSTQVQSDILNRIQESQRASGSRDPKSFCTNSVVWQNKL